MSTPPMDTRAVTRASFLTRITTKQVPVSARVYRCPKDGAVVLVIPADQSVPEETETVSCPNGDPVTVPKYRGPLSLSRG